MEKRTKELCIGILVGILVMMGSVQSTQAFSITYNDDVWEYLTVTGPNLTKAGNTESYTVSGKLKIAATGSVHVKFWLDTSSQVSKVVLEEDALPYGTYSAGYTFTKTYQVFIPANAINNGYLYAKLDTTTRHLSNFGVSLIQDPTYSQLQSQVNSLQTDKSNLQSQVNDLQSQITNLGAQNSTMTMFAIIASVVAVIFLGTTVYFATRKPKVKSPP